MFCEGDFAYQVNLFPGVTRFSEKVSSEFSLKQNIILAYKICE